MALPPKVDIGTAPNNGTGDPLRIAFQKLNARDGYLDVRIDSKIDQGGNTTDTGQSLRDDIDANAGNFQYYILLSEKGAAEGVATLGADQKLKSSQLPDLAITDVIVATETTIAAFTTNSGNYVFEQGDVIIIDNSGNLTHYIYKGGLKTDTNEYSAIATTEIEISQVNGLQDALAGKEPKNVPPIADDKVAVFNSDGSKRYEDYGGGAASLLTKTKTYTGGAQTITADFDIVQVSSLVVGNSFLQEGTQYTVSGAVVTILDTLTSGAVIQLKYWKANAVNATNYTKGESDAQFADKLDKTAEIQSFVSLTQAAYDAITTKSTTTIYFIE